MSVVLLKGIVNPTDLIKASEDYGDYIKVVVDVERGLVAIGGEWHADAEKVLIEEGSLSKNIWGGGIDIKTKNIETVALINLKPELKNNSQEILDPEIRDRFISIVKEIFGL
jgi:hypothetical protein